jgi:ABC-2 type transport system ATP-binding protein
MNGNGRFLEIRNLSRRFGRTEALKGIDLSIDEPGVHGFLGPNGAGKTTTFKIISSILKPDSGSVRICGIDLFANRVEALSKIGVQFDSPAFYPYLSGRENLMVRKRWLRGYQSMDVDRMIELSGLGDEASRKVKGYSWGMKQRLSLAAALLPDPRVLLLDEPTNGLDPAGIAYIRELIPRLAHGEGRAVLLSSHRMEEIQQICDRLIIIHRGKIMISGTGEELRVMKIVTDDNGKAADMLKLTPDVLNVTPAGEKAIEVIAPALKLRELTEILSGNSISVIDAGEKDFNLEEIFLRLTAEEANHVR